MMKKLFAILLALAMLMSLAAPAMAEEEVPVEAEQTESTGPVEAEAEPDEEDPEELPDLTGTWHGELLGMGVELTLNQGGAYTLTIEGADGTRNGLWTQDADGVYCDKDQDDALAFLADEGTLTVNLEGTEVELTRTPAETFQPADEKPESVARLRDFTGDWACNMVGMFDMFVDPVAESGGSPMKLSIDGETVSMTTSGDEEPVTANASYSAGVLTLSLGDDAGISCSLHALTDGGLRMDVVTASGTMAYYFVPAEAEAEPEGEAEEAMAEDEAEETAPEDEEDEDTEFGDAEYADAEYGDMAEPEGDEEL